MIVEVIATSSRGAKLISNGEKACWVQGRWVRKNNTLTPRGEAALENATMTHADAQDYQAYKQRRAEEREAEKEAFRKSQREKVEVRIRKAFYGGMTESGKAYKIWDGGYFNNKYKKPCKHHIFLACSQVDMKENEDSVTFLLPKWMKDMYSFWNVVEA